MTSVMYLSLFNSHIKTLVARLSNISVTAISHNNVSINRVTDA